MYGEQKNKHFLKEVDEFLKETNAELPARGGTTGE